MWRPRWFEVRRLDLPADRAFVDVLTEVERRVS